MKTRLFTFGCSFTQYLWPTWADILGQEFDEFQNWGQNGGGNYFIFNSLNECILRNKITEHDTIIIMWTNILREDRYIKDTWITPGNIYTQDTYNKKLVKYLVDERGYLLRDLAFIHSAKKILDSIGVKYIFASMVPITNIDQYSVSLIQNNDDIIDLYKEVIESIRPSVYETIFNFDWYSKPFPPANINHHAELYQRLYTALAGADWPSFKDFRNNDFQGIKKHILNEIQSTVSNLSSKLRIDLHPTPIEHLRYIETIMPEFDISESTKNWTQLVDDIVRAEQQFDDIWDQNLPLRF